MIDDLKAFVSVVEEKSLTKAADKLCITQSAISRRIQQLEVTLGAVLFDRSNRPLTPSVIGLRVYEEALQVLKQYNRLLSVPIEDATPSGTLRLGITQAIGDVILADTLHSLKSKFPLVDLRLRTDWSDLLTQNVLSGTLDAAVVLYGPQRQISPQLRGQKIDTLDVVVVQSREKPRTEGPKSLADLVDEDWILNPQGCGYRSELERVIGGRGETLRIVVDTYGTELQLRMIASGLGLGLVPRSVLNASLCKDFLDVLEVQDFSMSLDVWVIYGQAVGNLRRPVTTLIETVSARFSAYALQLNSDLTAG